MAAQALPESIIESIAIANAASIGEQPAILANLALSNQIFNQNLQQQTAIAQQHAMNQIALAVAAKCADLILSGDPGANAALDELRTAFDARRELVGTVPGGAAAEFVMEPQAEPVDGAPSKPASETVNAIAEGTLKGIAEQPAMLSNIAYSNMVANTNLMQQNAVSYQQAVNELGIAILARSVDLLANGDGETAAALQKLTATA